MKKMFKAISILIVILFGFNYFVFAEEINIYEENIFEFQKSEIDIDSEFELKIDTNLDIANEDIKWTVSDETIIDLSDGVVKPLKNGSVKVSAEYLPLNIKTTCIVNVKIVVGTPTLKVQTNTYNSLKISFSKSQNATHYEIQRSTKKNSGYKTITTTTSTSYTDKNLKCGTTYYYRVRALNKDSNIKSAYSSIISKKVTPSKITITSKKVKSYNSTYIKWNKVSGASGYRVYRATSKNGKYERLVTTTALSYTDTRLTSGKTYYYKVRAYKWVNGTKVFGPYSDIFTLTPKLSMPTVKIYHSGTSVRFEIDKVSGATGYRVYKSTSANGKYTRITSNTKTLHKDYDISYTNTYYYKVRAYKVVNGKKVFSEYTKPVKITTHVPRPIITVTRDDTSKLKVKWGKLTGCTGYEVYLSEDGKEYKTLKELAGYKTDNYTISRLELNQSYYIKARSYKIVNGQKVYSKDSNIVKFDLNQFLPALKSRYNCTVRSAASGSSKSIGTVYKNQIVLSYGMEGNYYKIKLNNKFGYIHKDNVSKYNDAKVLGVSNINQFSNQGGAPLPMGCEVTSLAAVLKYLGFSKVTKNLLADKYQPMGKVGKTDPNVAFVGTPYSSKPYGCYAPVIVKTANNYFKAIGNNEYQVNNLTGIDIEDLYKEIDKGNPLVMWITYGKPYKQESWVLNYGTKTTKEGEGKYNFTWYGLQHCVALAGYNKKKGTLIIADVGKAGELTEYSISSLKSGYNKLGKQIVSITKKQ